jgi:hypothetical protein
VELHPSHAPAKFSALGELGQRASTRYRSAFNIPTTAKLKGSKQAPGTLLPGVSENCTHVTEGNPLTSQATPLVDGVLLT